VYFIPRKAWRGNRNLADKNVAEASASVGFVRYEHKIATLIQIE
jgi:hypothetical protein